MTGRLGAGFKIAASVLVLAALELSVPGTRLIDFSTAVKPRLQTGPSGAPGALPWLHVEHPTRPRAFIADELGRTVILRGVASGGLMDYWAGTNPADLAPAPFFPIDPAAYEDRCAVNSATIWQPPLCRTDLAEMRARGFEVVRLALSWSLLEPRPGAYDRRCLDRIAQVVGWARAEGIYVILDMHENAYSRYIARPAPPPLPGHGDQPEPALRRAAMGGDHGLLAV